MKTHLESVVCSGFEESIVNCQHVLGGDNCSLSVGIECSKAIGYVVVMLQMYTVCVPAICSVLYVFAYVHEIVMLRVPSDVYVI